MQGCDNFCAYCIVPYVRGRQKSRAKGAILAECRELARRGAREITLLGQNVNSYGQDASGDGTSFPELLADVAAIPGIARVRFTTSHPKDLSDALIARFADTPALCPSLHLPVQSGSDAVLARMNDIVKAECDKAKLSHFLDTWSLLTDEQGNYSTFLPNDKGVKIKIRANDKVHFTVAGGDILAHYFLTQLAKDVELRPKVPHGRPDRAAVPAVA